MKIVTRRCANLAPLALTFFLVFFLTKQCHADPMSEKITTKKHIESIVQAYGPSIDALAAQYVYSIIVLDYHYNIGTIEQTIKEEAIDTLVREKIAQIERASPEEKLLIWEKDVAISQLIPRSRSALEMAKHVRNGGHLSLEQKNAASSGIEFLNLASHELHTLPVEIRESVADIVSETLLDFSYALDPETSPQSLRLNQQ